MYGTFEKSSPNSSKIDLHKYVINIKTGAIHDGQNPCPACRMMIEANKKYFGKLEEAENYFEGGKKGTRCGRCFRDKMP